jgi:lysozyme
MIKRSAVAGMGISAMLMVSVLVKENYTDKAIIPVPGDVPTIGAGRTGPDVKMGDVTNPVREMQFLLANLEKNYGAAVRNCITAPLHQYEFDALVDLAYNAGGGAVCREIAPKFNAAITEGDYQSACASIENWRITVAGRDCRIKTNNCRGLVIRRQAQRKQCDGK